MDAHAIDGLMGINEISECSWMDAGLRSHGSSRAVADMSVNREESRKAFKITVHRRLEFFVEIGGFNPQLSQAPSFSQSIDVIQRQLNARDGSGKKAVIFSETRTKEEVECS